MIETLQNPKLAIVVPAYKPMFLRRAIESIFAELTIETKLYIFDDASPFDLQAELVQLRQSERVKYLRFESNLGKNSLPEQWARCIEHTEGENWIWLFSDDDEVTPGTLTAILEAVKKSGPQVLLSLDTQLINSISERVSEVYTVPELESAFSYSVGRVVFGRPVFGGNFVFSRSMYDMAGGFIKTPLAWCSDELSWHRMVISCNGKIKRIHGALFLFRQSHVNISAPSAESVTSKANAVALAYKYWLDHLGFTQALNSLLLIIWAVRNYRYLNQSSGLLVEYIFARKNCELPPITALIAILCSNLPIVNRISFRKRIFSR